MDLLKPGTSCADIWNAYNDFMIKNGRPPERRLYCHGQGYDMVERPLVRADEPMPIVAGMNIACHPAFATEGSWNWVCDNFIVGDNGVEGRIHKTPQQIFEI